MTPNRDLNDEGSGFTAQQHEDIRERFPLYATAIAVGTAPPVDPELQAHLLACAACRAELDELIAITVAAFSGQLPHAASYPEADLSFLDRPPDPPPGDQLWLLDELGRLIIDLADILADALAPNVLMGTSRGQFLFRYIQEPGSVPDLEVTVDVVAEDAARTQARVCVSVDVPSRGPLDQIGSRVILRADDHEWEGETDESGCVDFAPIPLDAVPQLRVEIAPLRSYEL